jgi:hypothetical protein
MVERLANEDRVGDNMALDWNIPMSGKSISDYMNDVEDRKLKKELLSSKLAGGSSGSKAWQDAVLLSEQYALKGQNVSPEELYSQMTRSGVFRGTRFDPITGFENVTGIPEALSQQAFGEEEGKQTSKDIHEPQRAGNVRQAETNVDIVGKPLIAGDVKAAEQAVAQQTEPQVKATTEKYAKLSNDATAAQGLVEMGREIEKLIQEGTLGNSPKDRLKMMGHSLGVAQSPESINTAQVMKLGDQMVLARGSLGAGVSVADAVRYDRAAGDFSKAQSNSERLKAIQTMRSIAETAVNNFNTATQDLDTTGKLSPAKVPTEIKRKLKWNPATGRAE